MAFSAHLDVRSCFSVPGQGIEQRYTCCGSDTSVKWCEMAPVHVHETNRYTDLSHYKRTPDRTSSKGRRSLAKGVFALDCEMLYTTLGSELARVTVVDRNSATVYERTVQPKGRIIDYNTRFSGLTAEDFQKPEVTSLGQVQKDLRRMFNSETILIGHSLESDLIALKVGGERGLCGFQTVLSLLFACCRRQGALIALSCKEVSVMVVCSFEVNALRWKIIHFPSLFPQIT